METGLYSMFFARVILLRLLRFLRFFLRKTLRALRAFVRKPGLTQQLGAIVHFKHS